MANLSAIKLPNGTTYNLKDTVSGYTTNTGTITKVQTTAGAHTTVNVSSGAVTFNVPTKTSHLTNDSGFITNAGVTGVKGSAESSYRTGQVNLTPANLGAVSKNDELLTTNPFRPASLSGPYISKIDNGFYAANKRWNTSMTNISGASTSNLFDGSYETNVTIEAGKTSVLTMDFAPTTYFPGYPYGYILVSFYHTGIPVSVSGRVYCNYESHGIGWHDISFSPISDSGTSSMVYRSEHQGYYNISKLEISIVGASNPTTKVTQVEIHLDRPDSSRTPFLSKYGAETLYYDLTAPNFRGNLVGNVTGNVTGNVSGSAGSVAWSGVSSKPTATGSATTGISIANHSTTSIYGVSSSTTSVYGVSSTTTTASKVTLGTAKSIPNVTSAGSASTWTFESKSIPNVTAAGSASTWTFESKTVMTDLTMTINSTDSGQLDIAKSTTTVYSKSGGGNGTAPTLGTAITVYSKSGGGNGTAPTLGTVISVPNVTEVTDVTVPIKNADATTVPIKNTSATTVVTSATHSVTDNGHTHTI